MSTTAIVKRGLLPSALVALALAGCTADQSRISATGASSNHMLQRLALLEARAARLDDINDIKRLQRTYGYYVDEGQWDDVADLFAANATVEIGKDGVYRGRERIRTYFRTLGGGNIGLAPGQLNEHLQVMPVITLAGDGIRANGTWRAIILSGQLGGEAWWSEGPYENTYVKENGIWKIASLRWFQTLRVPYDGGWAKNGDTNGARFVGDQLQPDAPPTLDFKTWPGAFTPPFHFRGEYPGLEALPAPPPAALAGHAPRAARLWQTARQLSAQDEIENLQRIYGFYTDKGLWSDAATLFTDDAELQIQGRGTYRGRDRILAWLRAIGPEGVQAGRLYENMQLQPVTHVDASASTARARWHVFSQLARHGDFHEWATGIYENEYRRDANGKWRISRMHYYPTMVTPYDQGWGKASLPASRFEPSLPPDVPAAGPASTYDHAFVAPFHYPHPVRASDTRASGPVRLEQPDLDQLLDDAERLISTAEDRASIENVQTAYGYYLATLLWDDLTNLFADDGTIEIAMRGVYAGRDSVRRNLNLYGQAGLDDGVLHNHMQFQKVIHVAPDGRTANLRSRALSMMGNFGRNATWMAGTYENRFVKIEGRWKFQTDQQVNTYFAPYETGWKELAQRPPPGITDSNPPDRPPSFAFDLYPKNFLLPFHYPNPVSGRTVEAP